MIWILSNFFVSLYKLKNKIMNLQQISNKYRISEAYLNSKEDGLNVVALSLNDIIREMQSGKIDENRKESVIEKLERLSQFCKDVKNSGI